MPTVRHLRCLFAAAAVLSLPGCGSGGTSDPGPSDSKRADGPVQDDSTAVARARATEARVTAIRDEIEHLRAIDDKRVSKQYFKLYSLASNQYSRNLARSVAFNRRYVDALPSPSAVRSLAAAQARGRKQDRIIHQAWVREMRGTISSWKAYAARVADVPARDELERSTLATERDALDRSLETFRGFADHLGESKPGADQIPFYKTITGKQSAYPIFALVAKRYAKQLTTALQDDLADYEDPQAGLDQLPTVGDAYRKVILASFLSPAKKRSKDAAQRNVDGRLWLLSRARQLEDTPEETYEAARRALYIEAADDPRDSYLPLILMLTELKGILVITKDDVAKVRAFKSWADEVLDQPVVPLLEPTRDALRERIDAITTDGSEFDVRASQTKQSKRMTTELRKGASALDAPQRLRAQLEAALDATRP